MRQITLWTILICLNLNSVGADPLTLPDDWLQRGGFAVIIGGSDNVNAAVALVEGGPWVVHLQSDDAAEVEEARRQLMQRGLYGRVSVEQWPVDRKLPYADNLVNLLILAESRAESLRDEVGRVVAPEGAAVIRSNSGDDWKVQPRPAEMGDWTHFWQGADGNLASADLLFEPPNSVQWTAGAPFPFFHRRISFIAMYSAGGRVFSLTQNNANNLDNSLPHTFGAQPNYLVARDAFNGVILWQIPWQQRNAEALVATAERIYGVRDDSIVVLDSASGEEIAVWEVPDAPKKLVYESPVLLSESSSGLTALDTSSGRQLWHADLDLPWGTLVRDGRAFCIEGTRAADGKWQHELLAFNLFDGQRLWSHTIESELSHRESPLLKVHFVGDGFLVMVELTKLLCFSTEDGRLLWRRESEAGPRGTQDSRRAGHFLVNDKVFIRADRARGGRDAPEQWFFLDPLTGEIEREVSATGMQGVTSNVNKISCQRLTATQRFVIDGRLSTVWDNQTGERHGFKFARGACWLGIMPANGLAYHPANACGCVTEQIHGFLALAHVSDPGIEGQQPGPVETGPAYGMELVVGGSESDGGWPAYRRDGTRGAYSPSALSGNIEPLWSVNVGSHERNVDPDWRLAFGRTLSPPVAANGKVFFADPQAHQVIALEGETGAELWRYIAGGRVNLPPTLYRGLAIFGANDGYMYALRAADGELVWRIRVAPSDRRILAHGQLESAWPVVGGVLIHDGLALVTAGRAPDADGGLVVIAVDPASGEPQWYRRVTDVTHGNCEPLVTDGENVYLMDLRVDVRTGELEEIGRFSYRSGGRAERDALGFPEGTRYLRAGKAGMQGISWTRMAMGLRKGQSTWWLGDVEGEMLAFTNDQVYAFQLDVDRLWSGEPPVTPGGGLLIARPDRYQEFIIADGDWRFRPDPLDQGRAGGWNAIDLDESNWQDNFSAAAAWQDSKQADYPRVGWFRRSIVLPDFPSAKAVYLTFQGVDGNVDVWLNDHLLGTQANGPQGQPSSFEFDVAELVRPGEENLLGIRVHNEDGSGGAMLPVQFTVRAPTATSWKRNLPAPAQIEAMLVTPELLAVGGTDDRFDHFGPGFLRLIASSDGADVAALPLPIAPVHDGLAAADGRIYTVLRDGSVVAFGEPQ